MPENKKFKVVIDTNILISSLIGKEVEKLNEYLIENSFIVLFSNESFNEFTDVVSRPKLKKLFNPDRVNRLILLLKEVKKFVKVKSKADICRDSKDNFILDLAYYGKADYVITGDKDLLILEKYHKTKIVSFSQFVKIFPLK